MTKYYKVGKNKNKKHWPGGSLLVKFVHIDAHDVIFFH